MFPIWKISTSMNSPKERPGNSELRCFDFNPIQTEKPSNYRWCHTISLRPRHICSAVHYRVVVTNTMLSQITSVSIANSTVCSGADQSKNQRSASLALVRGIHRSPMNSPHNGLMTRTIFHLMTSWNPISTDCYRKYIIGFSISGWYDVSLGVDN